MVLENGSDGIGAGGEGAALGGSAAGAGVPGDPAPAPDPSAAAGAKPGEGGAVGDAPPAFSPNFNVRSYDKDYEIPEAFRALIKDKDSEKMVREVFERAYGLDNMKGVHQNVRQENVQLKEWKESTEREIDGLNTALAAKDFDTVSEILGISEEDIIRHAIKLVERTPEQKAAWQTQRMQSQQLSQRDTEYQRVLRENEQMAVRMREIELDQHLFKPEVSAIAQKYNAGQSNPDAFRNLVVRVGQSYAAMQKDISVADAVKEAIGLLGGLITPDSANAGQPPVAQNSQVVRKNEKETLPNIGGSNKTPVKSQVNSIEDIKRIRDAMA